jgi:TRAP-type transport system periplasmic protein
MTMLCFWEKLLDKAFMVSSLHKFIIASSICLMCQLVQAQDDVVHLKLHHMLSSAAPGHRLMLLEWSERIAQESNGRLQIKVFPSMQLGAQAAAILDQVRDGIVDIGWTLPGYSPGRFPNIEVFELPFMVSTPEVMNRAMHDFQQNHPEEFAAVKVLQLFVHKGQVIHSKQPIRSVEDFRDKKIRIPSRVSSWIVDALGGTPLGTPVQKIPELLSKGIIDATFIPYEASYGLRIHELVDYHITFEMENSDRIQTQIFILAMNRDVYNSLDDELKKVIDNNSGISMIPWFSQLWVDFEVPGERAARESGELITLPAEDVLTIREMVEEPVADKWVSVVEKQGVDGRALIEEAKMLLEKYENQRTSD